MADYNIIDHGKWSLYTPDVLPGWAADLKIQGNVAYFSRRDSDGVDFYDFRNGKPFQDNSLVCTVLTDPATGVETVKAVFRDHTMLFPFTQRIIEIVGHDVEDGKPHNEFAWLTYDPETKTLSGVPEMPKPEIAVASSQAKIQLSRMKRGDSNLYLMTADLVAKSGDLELQIWWAEAKRWRPSNVNVQKIGAAFGLSSEDILAAFDAASKIQE